jgi:peptidoglycan/xylan/chitin deacetylase (PgdA/CDA1 family)
VNYKQNVCGTGVAYCGAPGCQLSFGPACDGNQAPTGKDTSNIPRPQFGNVPYGVSISHCSQNGYVALTFDDGPYIYTSDMLDLLKRNNVSATFFVVGANGGKGQIENPSTGYPDIIRRMILEGHQVGSHTWSHQDLATTTAVQMHEQVVWNEMAFVDILGFFPTYLRPPYTDWTPDTLSYLSSMGYHVVGADLWVARCYFA